MILFEKLDSLITDRFHGHLKAGKHESNGECCALELLSVARDLSWTDEPKTVRCWDLRPLNDIEVPDDVRRQYLLPVIAVYDGSLDWPEDRQREVAMRLAILTVNRLASGLPGLPPKIVEACATATDLESAVAAAARSAAWAEAAARSAAARSAAARSEAAESAVAESAVAAAVAAAARSARSAARAAWSASAWSAESAAEAAAEAAVAAAVAAARSAEAAVAARVTIFTTACGVWLDALKP
jgi:hypothetical protein